MNPNLHFISTRHRRVTNGWEQAPSYALREITIQRTADLQRLAVTIAPTLSTKYAKLWQTTDIFSHEIIRQNIETDNMLKYIGDDPDYIFYIRNKESFVLDTSFFNPFATLINPIEICFSENDDLMFVLERKDINIKIEYYK